VPQEEAMNDTDRSRNPEMAPDDEIEPRDVAEQDFATRNVIMSNALQGGASPAAGSVIGTGGELGMQPETDEALADDEDQLPIHEKRDERAAERGGDRP
jgi:hypothetical protein